MSNLPEVEHVLEVMNIGQELHLVVTRENVKNGKPDLILDAIIGYSLTGETKGNALIMIQYVAKKSAVVISLDVPSGIDSTTGKRAVNQINPNATLTLALPKTGLFPEVSGELYVADIGIPNLVYKKLNIGYISPFGKNSFIKFKIL